MKIAMIGSGAAGSVFAAYLRLGGAEVYLVDKYKAHMDAIAANGLSFSSPDGTRMVTGFHTSEKAGGLPVMDIVILMVKATQTDDVMPDVMNCVGDNTVVVSLQNGLGNDDTLSKYIPRSRIMYGAGVIGTELPGPGMCIAKPEKGVTMFFGAVEKSPETDVVGGYLERCFKAGGCEAVFEPDVRIRLWKKAISNSGYNTVSAILRLRVGEVTTTDIGKELIFSVWREGCEVAKAAGVGDLWPIMVEEYPNVAASFGSYYPSMAQDVMRHRQTEISVLNGALVRYGKRYGVPTPVNAALEQLITVIQDNYDNQF